jgi:integrase
MPRARLTKSTIDALPVPSAETVYWDEMLPGFGVKVTPAGRKVFIVLYRTAGSGSRLRKYTIGPHGRVTLHLARGEAQRVLGARREGRDLAGEKREARRRLSTDRVEDVVEAFAKQHLAKRKSGPEISRLLKRELVERWGARSIHTITKREVVSLLAEVVDRGTPVAANKLHKVCGTFFNWCVGRALLERSPCGGIPTPTPAVSRDRVLSDAELASVLRAARQIGGAYGGIVELLALTAQRREEVAQMTWDELDLREGLWTLAGVRTKNGRPHLVYLSDPAIAVVRKMPALGRFVFTPTGKLPFRGFSIAKRRLDELTGVQNWRIHDLRRTAVSGMARLGIAPHVADKILNHTSGTISGVAAVYQRHEFMAERKHALTRWGAHVSAFAGRAATRSRPLTAKTGVRVP